MYFMGIDGGGSNLRVVIVNEQMQIQAITKRGTANPNIIGRESSAELIQSAMRETLSQANVEVSGVGIGIAGASAVYARDWLQSLVHVVLPDVFVAAASDNEIALVGANGAREGILLLAGTGSVTFGVNKAGDSKQVGGWGYLLGDEGSGYWIGMQALRAFVQACDGQLQIATTLKHRIFDELKLSSPTDVLAWVYGQKPTPVAEVAKLARIVLEEAENGDNQAQQIIVSAAQHLAHLAQTTIRELNMIEPKIAFAGGLLESPNILSAQVMQKLAVAEHPQAQYPPMIGAALLAQLTYEKSTIQE